MAWSTRATGNPPRPMRKHGARTQMQRHARERCSRRLTQSQQLLSSSTLSAQQLLRERVRAERAARTERWRCSCVAAERASSAAPLTSLLFVLRQQLSLPLSLRPVSEAPAQRRTAIRRQSSAGQNSAVTAEKVSLLPRLPGTHGGRSEPSGKTGELNSLHTLVIKQCATARARRSPSSPSHSLSARSKASAHAHRSDLHFLNFFNQPYLHTPLTSRRVHVLIVHIWKRKLRGKRGRVPLPGNAAFQIRALPCGWAEPPSVRYSGSSCADVERKASRSSSSSLRHAGWRSENSY
ncbi:hypothetical protein MHYP_G00172350 [Metynnis hypsauchen]